jgi:hypothetical protein
MGDFKELDDVKSPFAALNLGDERLGTRQPLCQLRLCQPRVTARLHEHLPEQVVLLGKYGLGHIDTLKPVME